MLQRLESEAPSGHRANRKIPALSFVLVVPPCISKRSKDPSRGQKTWQPTRHLFRLEQMERIRDQVVYVFPMESSKKMDNNAERRVRSFWMPKQIRQGR